MYMSLRIYIHISNKFNEASRMLQIALNMNLSNYNMMTYHLSRN